MKESKLQTQVIKFLKSKGCYVIKTQPGAGIPVGCPDIIALFEGCWLAIECKADAKSSYQPLQEETLEKLDEWSYAKMICPQNWSIIKQELEAFIG